MSQKNKGNEILHLHANPIKPLTENTSTNRPPSYEEIRRRAYELYLERDGVGGDEVDDWLQAEAELGRNVIVTRTSKETEQKA